MLNLMMKLSLYLMLLVLLCGGGQVCMAQTPDASSPADTQARQLDRFGPIPYCDHTARLDNFAVELQKNPAVRGYIVAYGGRIDAPAVVRSWLAREIDYLVNMRGVDAARFVAVEGGLRDRDELEVELWIVPEGADAPEPRATLTEETRKAFRGKLYEFQTSEDYFDPCGEYGCPRYYVSFADWLKAAPELHGYLVVYTDKDSTPGAWRRIARREQQHVLTNSQLESNRITIINAGAGATSKVEFWVLDADAPPPVAAVKDEKVLAATFRLRELDSYQLSDEQESAWVREGLVELLREHNDARVYLIIHPPAPEAEAADEAELEAPAAVEPEAPEQNEAEPEQNKAEPVQRTLEAEPPQQTAAPDDVSEAEPQSLAPEQAAEIWQKELSKKYGVAARRIEVLVGRASEWGEGTMAVWVVPHGAPPPDPFAPDREEQQADEPEVESPANEAAQQQQTRARAGQPPPRR